MYLRTKKGVTLIEVLVAIAVFSVAIAILFAAITTATLYTARARHREAAIFIAKEEIERAFYMAVNGNFDNIPGLAGSTAAPAPLDDFGGQIDIAVAQLDYWEDYPGNNPTPSIPPNIGVDPAGCYEVAVTVSWNDFEWSGLRLGRSATVSTERLCSVVGRGE